MVVSTYYHRSAIDRIVPKPSFKNNLMTPKYYDILESNLGRSNLRENVLLEFEIGKLLFNFNAVPLKEMPPQTFKNAEVQSTSGDLNAHLSKSVKTGRII